jgi:UDP-glucose:O-linked fucose beta-1,3-glucosyltransferase
LQTHEKPIDFVIDVKYELNQSINELTATTLIDRSDLFCYEDREGCLTWLDGREEYSCQRADIHLTDVYFGIKTFVGYHQQRLGLLRKTWLNEELHYNLFTNEVNTTADRQNDRFVITGENTVRGHCHKTMFILNYFYRTKSTLNYLIVADDDTLLSVQGVLRLLRCFMLAKDVPLVLGERYGYQDAYDYPTGGSGILLNRQAVELIVHNCQCPSADTPDDMFLGICLKRLQIPLIHIPELHQAQPNAYPKDWLAHQKPISFHKFEGIDVEHIYRTYLDDDDDDRRDRHVNEEL